MSDEAQLEALDSGLAPRDEGWFVVNARDAAWQTHPKLGARCTFELSRRVLSGREDVEPHPFPQVGVEPGRRLAGPAQHPLSRRDRAGGLPGPCGRMHRHHRGRGAASAGMGLRPLPARHAPRVRRGGRWPCVIFMLGHRPNRGIDYPRSEPALRHGAGVETPTDSPREAYAPVGHWRPARPERWEELPWSR